MNLEEELRIAFRRAMRSSLSMIVAAAAILVVLLGIIRPDWATDAPGLALMIVGTLYAFTLMVSAHLLPDSAASGDEVDGPRGTSAINALYRASMLLSLGALILGSVFFLAGLRFGAVGYMSGCAMFLTAVPQRAMWRQWARQAGLHIEMQ